MATFHQLMHRSPADVLSIPGEGSSGVASPTNAALILSQLDNKKHTAILDIINRNVKQHTALRICHSYRWNQEYVNFRMECKPE